MAGIANHAGQKPPRRRSCATMNVHERLMRTHPGYMRARASSENHFKAFMERGGRLARSGVTSVSVVVHVVYNTEEQNISDAQVASQIDVLNRDYRRLNNDAASVPAAFRQLAADARVEFRLATLDPQGNETSGITHTRTDVAAFSDDDAVKSARTGGHDPWDPGRYLNLWVCPLANDLLGYAQFPGGPAATDGVVIEHSAFGTTGTATAPFNLGRTATHEIGHWLNLRHIWGDDGNGCNGSDFVDDTPNQGGPNYGVPHFPHVSCSNAPNGDMFMNFMDYVDDAAMNMFTSGQITRMQACLDSDRQTIGSQIQGATPPAEAPAPAGEAAQQPPVPAFGQSGGTGLAACDLPAQSLSFRDLTGPRGPLEVSYPGAPGGRREASPFLLSTPPRSMTWTQSFPGLAAGAVPVQPTLGRLQPSGPVTKLARLELQLQVLAQADAAGMLGQADIEPANRLYQAYAQIAAALDQVVGN